MALTGTETTTMSVTIDKATRRTAAEVVLAHVPESDLPLVLHVLGYKLRHPLDLDLPPTAEVCRNGHPQSGENIDRNANGMPYCVACAADRARTKQEREQAARA
jgi:hypothetical protein